MLHLPSQILYFEFLRLCLLEVDFLVHQVFEMRLLLIWRKILVEKLWKKLEVHLFVFYESFFLFPLKFYP